MTIRIVPWLTASWLFLQMVKAKLQVTDLPTPKHQPLSSFSTNRMWLVMVRDASFINLGSVGAIGWVKNKASTLF